MFVLIDDVKLQGSRRKINQRSMNRRNESLDFWKLKVVLFPTGLF